MAETKPAPLKRLIAEGRERVQAQRELVETRLEEGVKAYLSRLRIPSRHDIEALKAEIEGLEARTASLERSKAE